MRIVLSLVSLLILVPLLRSLTIPLLAALINLLTVSATFGMLALLFNGSLLGGPGYVDTTVLPATILVMFALAIDYEVFVFARIREEYLLTGSTSAAVSNGLDRTAHVVTGAAIIMIYDLPRLLGFGLHDDPQLRRGAGGRRIHRRLHRQADRHSGGDGLARQVVLVDAALAGSTAAGRLPDSRWGGTARGRLSYAWPRWGELSKTERTLSRTSGERLNLAAGRPEVSPSLTPGRARITPSASSASRCRRSVW